MDFDRTEGDKIDLCELGVTWADVSFNDATDTVTVNTAAVHCSSSCSGPRIIQRDRLQLLIERSGWKERRLGETGAPFFMARNKALKLLSSTRNLFARPVSLQHRERCFHSIFCGENQKKYFRLSQKLYLTSV